MNTNYHTVSICKRIKNGRFTVNDNIIKMNKNNSVIFKKKTNRISSTKKSTVLYDCLLTEEINYFKDKKDYYIPSDSKRPYSFHKSLFNGNIIRVYCDAASYNHGYTSKNDNDNFSVASYLIKYDDREIFQKSKMIDGCIDNNHAEIIACNLALNYINNNFMDKNNLKIIVYSDSLNLINYGTEKENLFKTIKRSNNIFISQFYCEQMQNILHDLNTLTNKLDVYFCWVKGHQLEKETNCEHVRYQVKTDTMCKEKIKEELIRRGIINYECSTT